MEDRDRTRDIKKRAAMTLGAIVAIIGILGFIPGTKDTQNQLFGLFQDGPSLNTILLLTGILSMIAGSISERAAGSFFRAGAVVYAVLAILALIVGNHGQVLGFIDNNYWNVLLYAVPAILYARYGWADSRERADAGATGDAMAFGEYERNRRR